MDKKPEKSNDKADGVQVGNGRKLKAEGIEVGNGRKIKAEGIEVGNANKAGDKKRK
jgi:hypothetical protein